MSRVVIESKGVDKLIKDMDGYTKELHRRISSSISKNGNNTVAEARTNHRFKSGDGNSGNLDRSVTFEQKREGNTHKADIYLNDKFTTTKNGKSYGPFIHEGTYQGYEQSGIAPKYTHSISKSGGGWKADPFLYNAIKKKFKINQSLKGISKRLKEKYERK